MKLSTIALLCLLLTGLPQSHAQVYDNAKAAFKAAQAAHLPVLLIFSGSDWCPNCMRLSKKVLTDESFKQELPKLAVLLNADFPQRKKLPPAVTHQNDSLAAIYNEKGLYPHIVLIHSSIPGSYRELVYTTQSAAEFIADIKKTRSAIAP